MARRDSTAGGKNDRLTNFDDPADPDCAKCGASDVFYEDASEFLDYLPAKPLCRPCVMKTRPK